VPDSGRKLAQQIAAHQGVFIATPEYNNSPPPLLSNAISWVSRVKDSEIQYRERIYAVGSSAPGQYGGARALHDLRKIIHNGLGGILLADKVEVPNAKDAFDESGNLIAEAARPRLTRLSKNLVKYAARLAD
jgi:chromate reductase